MTHFAKVNGKTIPMTGTVIKADDALISKSDRKFIADWRKTPVLCEGKWYASVVDARALLGTISQGGVNYYNRPVKV